MKGLRILIPAMAVLGLLAFAVQAQASPVAVTFQVSGIPLSTPVYYLNVYASSGQSCGIAASGGSIGTCGFTLPSQGRYRFRVDFKVTRGVSAQSIEFWEDIPNSGTFTVNIPVHEVAFTRTNGACGVNKIFGLSSASVTYGQDISRPDNRVGGTGGYSSPSIQIGQTNSAGDLTTPMLDGCYTITAGSAGCPGTAGSCQTVVNPPLCVGPSTDDSGTPIPYSYTGVCPN